MHATTKCERAADLTSWMRRSVDMQIGDLLVRRLTLEPRCMVSSLQSDRRRPTSRRGHLGGAPPGVRRADTLSPRGARRLRFACRSTRLYD